MTMALGFSSRFIGKMVNTAPTSIVSVNMNSTSMGSGSFVSTYSYSNAIVSTLLSAKVQCVTDLEKDQERIKFLPERTLVETHPAAIQQNANKADAEEIVRNIDGADLLRKRTTIGCRVREGWGCIGIYFVSEEKEIRTMAKGYQRPKSVKDQ